MKLVHSLVLFAGFVMPGLFACQNDNGPQQIQKTVEAEGGQKDTISNPENQSTVPTKLPALSVCLDMASANDTHTIITIYRKQDIFLQRTSCFKELDCVFASGQECVSIEMPYGMYAIAVFNDMNGNNLLDKNLLGMPAEGYGFSSMKGAIIRVPHYLDCQFEFNELNTNCSISMRNIK
ncbi:MAG: DUF2141 domain-containing protein [Flavobacteriales bacterium]